MEHISNFELYGNQDYTKKKPFRCFEKINIFLFLVFAIELLYLICLLYELNNKTNHYYQLNYRKYELNNNNEKLSQELFQSIEKNLSYDKEIKEKNDKIKILEEHICDYKQLSKELLKSNFSDNEIYIKLIEKNKKKNRQINDLKSLKEKEKRNFSEKIDSKIIDKEIELNNIINIISNINMNEINNKFQLCYRGENNNYNFTEAYEKCGFKENISYMILYQTDIYKRYGAYISKNKEHNSFIFSLYPNGLLSEMKLEEIDLNRKQSLIYIINLIKQYKYDNKENSLDSKSSIFDFEIFLN